MALADNLVFRAKMDESSGNTTDSVGSKVGTAINGATFATGKIGNGGSFDGTTDYFRFADHTDFDFGTTGDISYSFWCYQNSLINYKYICNQRFNNGSTGAQIGIFSQPGSATGDSMAFFIYNGSAGQQIGSTNGSHSAGVREHWVFTRESSGTIMRVYKNGTLNNSATGLTARLGDNNGYFSIGENIGQPGGWNGKIDELGIRKGRAITSTEVSELYNGGSGISYPFPSSNSNFLSFF